MLRPNVFRTSSSVFQLHYVDTCTHVCLYLKAVREIESLSYLILLKKKRKNIVPRSIHSGFVFNKVDALWPNSNSFICSTNSNVYCTQNLTPALEVCDDWSLIPAFSFLFTTGSIAIIVPLVLLVILITTVVAGVFVCRRQQRYCRNTACGWEDSSLYTLRVKMCTCCHGAKLHIEKNTICKLFKWPVHSEWPL